MNRKLKALALALLAFAAMSALSASAAQASGEKFHCKTTNCVLTGTSEEGTVHVFSTGSVSSECHASFQGVTSAETETGITLVPSYTECGATGMGGGTGANGEGIPPAHCAYLLTSTTTEATAPVHIECAEGAKMTFEMPGACTLSIGEQTVKKGGVHYAKAEPGDSTFTAELNLSEISITKTGSLCFLYGSSMSIQSRAVFHCYENAGSPPTGTEKTTVTKTSEGGLVNCWHE